MYPEHQTPKKSGWASANQQQQLQQQTLAALLLLQVVVAVGPSSKLVPRRRAPLESHQNRTCCQACAARPLDFDWNNNI